MNFFKFLGELALIYLLYKLIFNFIIPAYKGIKLVKTKMNDVAARMQEQQRGHNHSPTAQPTPKTTKHASDDYIDYEEVK